MRNHVLGIFVSIFLSASYASAKAQYGVTEAQQETLQWAFDKAQRFSGIQSQASDHWKTLRVYLLTDDELSAQICPEDPQNCHGLVGLFDTQKKIIYLREDLSPDNDMVSISFLVHEMVHFLQSETRSDDDLFGTCQKLYATERQAYEAQDAFLKSEGQFFRAGNALRYFICHDESK